MSLRTIKNNKRKNQKFNDQPSFDEKQESRQWLLVSLLSLILLVAFTIAANAQSVVINNLPEKILFMNYVNTITDTIRQEKKKEYATAGCQTAISGEFKKMKKWEQQYNKYIKTADGFASALKAATNIYNDGLHILINLCRLSKATQNNPQGLLATLSMNDLYMETVTEFISIGVLLKNTIAKGGEKNMMTAEQRLKALWSLEEKISTFSNKLHLLYYSIRHYKMIDVWNKATAGIIKKDKATVAKQCLDHWKRSAKESNDYK